MSALNKQGWSNMQIRKAVSMNVGSGPSAGPTNWNWFSQDVVDFFSLATDKDIVKGITECPQVAAILYRKSQAFANGKLQVLKMSNDNLVTGKFEKWQKLVDKPNILQNGKQFRSQVEFYTLAFGYCPILTIKVEDMTGEFVKSMWVIPPHTCKITYKKIQPFYSETFNDLIDTFVICAHGKEYPIDVNDIFIYKDITDTRSDIPLPKSRITTLHYPINNAVLNYKSRARLISKPYGLLSNAAKDAISTIDLDPEERDKVQQDLKNYGTEDGQWDMVITNATLQFTPMMPSVKDLDLLNLMKSDSAVICDVLGYEYDLLSRDIGGVALNNKNESSKLLYQNFIIPEAENLDEQTGQMLKAEENKVKYVSDFSHLPVFQEDEMSKANTSKVQGENATFLWEKNAITHGVYMKRLKEPVVTEWENLYFYQMPFNQKADNNSNQNNNDNGTQQQ